MPAPQKAILLPDLQPVVSLQEYRGRGGMEAFEKALKMQPAEIIASIRQAGLRGRGGAVR